MGGRGTIIGACLGAFIVASLTKWYGALKRQRLYTGYYQVSILVDAVSIDTGG
jgi:ABC-type xylose transport system permease subunit